MLRRRASECSCLLTAWRVWRRCQVEREKEMVLSFASASGRYPSVPATTIYALLRTSQSHVDTFSTAKAENEKAPEIH